MTRNEEQRASTCTALIFRLRLVFVNEDYRGPEVKSRFKTSVLYKHEKRVNHPKEDKVVVISGGGSEIGALIALQFAKTGYKKMALVKEANLVRVIKQTDRLTSMKMVLARWQSNARMPACVC